MGLFDRAKQRKHVQEAIDTGNLIGAALSQIVPRPIFEKPKPPVDDLTKVLVIRDCSDCPHHDHSGAFTKGGAKQICGHRHTVQDRGADWFKRKISNYPEVPFWCPLMSVAELVKMHGPKETKSVHAE